MYLFVCLFIIDDYLCVGGEGPLRVSVLGYTCDFAYVCVSIHACVSVCMYACAWLCALGCRDQTVAGSWWELDQLEREVRDGQGRGVEGLIRL